MPLAQLDTRTFVPGALSALRVTATSVARGVTGRVGCDTRPIILQRISLERLTPIFLHTSLRI